MFSADVLALLACTGKGAAERLAQAPAPVLAGRRHRRAQAQGMHGRAVPDVRANFGFTAKYKDKAPQAS